jgi:hypothetical protein
MVSGHALVRLTGSLHFPHLQLILASSSQAKALPGYRGLSSKGIRILRYLFEDYAFDPDRRELYRGAEVVPRQLVFVKQMETGPKHVQRNKDQ